MCQGKGVTALHTDSLQLGHSLWRTTASQLLRAAPSEMLCQGRGCFSSPCFRDCPNELSGLLQLSWIMQQPSTSHIAQQVKGLWSPQPLSETVQEATWPHPNILGRGGCSPRRTLLFLFQWLLTQHPLGEEVHTLTDEPRREQVPKGPRQRGEMSQKHRLMAIPVCSKTKPGSTAVSKTSHSREGNITNLIKIRFYCC